MKLTPHEEVLLQKLRTLPIARQQEVVRFVNFLVNEQPQGSEGAGESIIGLLADLNHHITEEDIAEARREMWGGYRCVNHS